MEIKIKNKIKNNCNCMCDCFKNQETDVEKQIERLNIIKKKIDILLNEYNKLYNIINIEKKTQ